MYFSIVNIAKLYKINTVSGFKKSLLEYKVLEILVVTVDTTTKKLPLVDSSTTVISI